MIAKFVKAVEENNLTRVRLFLSNELMLDPRGNSFREMLTYAEANMKSLYDANDGSSFRLDPSQWDKDYLFQLKNELDDNFSRERLSHYEQVAKKVLKEKADKLDSEEAAQKKDNPVTPKEELSEEKADNKKVYQGITIGGAILTLFGLIASKTPITVIGVAGVVVGGVLLNKENKK